MNCYNCVYHRCIPGSAHLACVSVPDKDKFIMLLGVMVDARIDGMTFHRHGVENGWCNWPVDFDPVWVQACDRYQEIPQCHTTTE